MANLLKKILIISSLVGLLFVNNFYYVFANEVNITTGINQTIQGNNKTPNDELAQSIRLYQTVGQTLYAFTWPILVIAGTFLDNQVVYGSFLGMDVELWKLWNVMRTFANYVIGFLLIFSIFTLFLGGKFEKFNPTKLLPQLAVGAILVNTSWFLIGVCIDLSNILTYAVGAIPLKVANNANLLKDINYTKVGIKFQSNKNDPMVVGIIDDNNNLIPFCKFTYDGEEKKFVASIDADFDSLSSSTEGECVYLCGGKYYKLRNGSKISKIIPTNEGRCEGAILNSRSEESNISKLMLNPLVSIYAGLLNVGHLATFAYGGTGIMFTETLLKLLFLLALIIPLLVLAIILVVRVVLIWMYIIISPFIFLFIPLKDIGGRFLGEKGNFKNVCCIIFLPVYVVFTLSMSIVFLHAINFNQKEDINSARNGGFLKYLGVNECESTDEKSGCIKIQPIPGNEDRTIKIHTDVNSNSSSSMITNFTDFDKFLTLVIKRIFGIGFMWITVFTALKSCKVTEKIASSIQNFTRNMAKTVPIISVPGAGSQSIGSLGQWVGSLRRIPQSKQQEQFNKKIEPWLSEIQRITTGVENENIKKANNEIVNVQKTTFSPRSVINTISKNNTYKNLLNEKVSDILKDNTSLQYLVNQVGISENELKEMMESSDNNITLKKFLETYKKNISTTLQKQSLKKFISDYVLGKRITLIQLSDIAKDYVKKILSEVTHIDIPEISANKELAQALFELGFSENEIMKLLASNLEDNEIPDDEKNDIEKIINEVKLKIKESKTQ